MSLSEEFLKKYLNNYFSLKSVLPLSTSLLSALPLISSRFLPILGFIPFANVISGILLAYLALPKKVKDDISKRFKNDLLEYDKLGTKYGILKDKDMIKHSNHIIETQNKKFLKRFLLESEAREKESIDLFGEIINVRKGKNKKFFIFVSGFRSNPEDIEKRAEYLNYFEPIIKDSSFLVYVWDTHGYWCLNSWVQAKINTQPYSKSLLHSVNNYFTEYDEIIFIGHSLGCRLLYEMMNFRLKLNHLNIKIYFMGAAVSNKIDTGFLDNDTVLYNNYSSSDSILSKLYRAAERFQEPLGSVGSHIKHPNLIDNDCSDFVKGHNKYFENLKKIIL